ncbi:PepSY-associated TM helix domain-containing protein [Thiohalorhabdus sp. Cl-TMA]|uniref:PepSY-associated TM helix domain-containing protein n=1 Tax=Thiohalorhabdus methylotrophus TaxID=3242694 RepID=A0ABV4U0L2_9GAMM
MRRTLMSVHRWTGLILGLFLAVEGLLGAWLVIAEPLDEWLHPEILQSQPQAGSEPVGLAAAYDAVSEAHPDRPIWLLMQPDEPTGVYKAVLEGHHGPRVYVDAYTGAVLGERAAFSTLETPIRVIHTGEFGGAWLETGMGILAIAMLGLAITGIVVWWPGWKWLRTGLGLSTASLADLSRDGHRWAGLIGLPFLAIIAASGIYLIFHHAVQDTVHAVTGEETHFPPPIELAEEAGPMPPDHVRAMVASAREAVPEARITLLGFPTEAGRAVQARMRYPGEWHPIGNSRILLHPDSGALLAAYDFQEAGPGDYAMDHLYPLHIGTYGGTAARTAHFVAGLLPTLFLLTGTYIWWRRRKLRRKRARPRGGGARAGSR